MNPEILELHVIRQGGKHRQLHLGVCGVSSAGEGRIFEILVNSAAQVSLMHRGLLTSQSLRRSAAPVTLRVANGEMMEGRLNEAEISLEFVSHEQLSSPDLGRKHQIEGFLYEGDLREWDMITRLDFLTSPTPGSFPTGRPCSSRGRQVQLAEHVHGASGVPSGTS